MAARNALAKDCEIDDRQNKTIRQNHDADETLTKMTGPLRSGKSYQNDQRTTNQDPETSGLQNNRDAPEETNSGLNKWDISWDVIRQAQKVGRNVKKKF